MRISDRRILPGNRVQWYGWRRLLGKADQGDPYLTRWNLISGHCLLMKLIPAACAPSEGRPLVFFLHCETRFATMCLFEILQL